MSEVLLKYEKLPKNWELVTLATLLVEFEAGTRPKGGVGKYSEGVPSLGAEHLNSNGGFKFEKIKRQDKLNVSWTLKHFWIISFLYILTQFIISLIYDYQNSLNYYFDILDYYSEEVTTELELISSNSQLIFCCM